MGAVSNLARLARFSRKKGWCKGGVAVENWLMAAAKESCIQELADLTIPSAFVAPLQRQKQPVRSRKRSMSELSISSKEQYGLIGGEPETPPDQLSSALEQPQTPPEKRHVPLGQILCSNQKSLEVCNAKEPESTRDQRASEEWGVVKDAFLQHLFDDSFSTTTEAAVPT